MIVFSFPHRGLCRRLTAFGAILLFPAAAAALSHPPLQPSHEPSTGRALYERACANCHGSEGRGADREQVGFDDPLPDFTECTFSTREPDVDWTAIVHDGGPARAFGQMMPAFGDTMSPEEIARVLAYVRSFCTENGWPRGELNLPRPLVTEKAFPEDELVLSTSVATEGDGSISSKIVYERRFGARNQVEIIVPFAFEESGAPARSWSGGVGDLAVGAKRAFYHDATRGSIFSAAAEIILPSGSRDRGFGKGTPVFEPFVAFGKILPQNSFFQLQSGVELPFDTDRAAREAFWRFVLGRSFRQARWGRTWSPMLELVAARELVADEPVQWDVVPQVQVTLSTRQHIMASIGVRLPVSERQRSTQVMAYLLWDWFDGPLFKGW